MLTRLIELAFETPINLVGFLLMLWILVWGLVSIVHALTPYEIHKHKDKDELDE